MTTPPDPSPAAEQPMDLASRISASILDNFEVQAGKWIDNEIVYRLIDEDEIAALIRPFVSDLEAWNSEIRDAIHRSGIGIIRTSQGPSGTMIGYSAESEAEHSRRTLEVIHENIDLGRQLASAQQAKQAALGMVAQMREALNELHDAVGGLVKCEGGESLDDAWMKSGRTLASAAELLGEAGS